MTPGRDGEPTPPVRAVLFDATGTLFDTRESVGTVYARIANAHGVALPAWRLDDAFKRIMARAGPRVFPDCDLESAREREEQWWRAVVRSTFLAADSTVKFEDAESFFRAVFEAYLQESAWALRPGCLDTLRELKRAGYQTGVVSNFDQRLPIILQALGVAEFLDVVMIPARCHFEKPDPEIFEAALRALTVMPREAVFVGDHPETDRAAAERVGMRSLDPNAFEPFSDICRAIEAMSWAPEPSRQGEAR